MKLPTVHWSQRTDYEVFMKLLIRKIENTNEA